MKNLYLRFKSVIISKQMIDEGDRILLSLSAGKDSMALFYLMEQLKKEISFETGIFHLNHMMRGEESDKDELFVRELSERHGIEFYIKSFNFPGSNRSGLSFEEFARNIRYDMLQTICNNNNYNKSSTAHTLNDNAETVLMRILSGTGVKGLAGISAQTNGIIRPLLIFSSEEIYEYLKNNSINWREDESNYDETYQRNFVRQKLFPIISERFSNAERNILKLAANATEHDRLLNNFISEHYQKQIIREDNSVIIYIDRLPKDVAILKNIILNEVYKFSGMNLTFKIISEILKKMKSTASNLILYKNPVITIKRRFNRHEKTIVIYRTSETSQNSEWSYDFLIDETVEIDIKEIGKKISIKSVDRDCFNVNRHKSETVFLSLPGDVNRLKIRNRRVGDRIVLDIGTKKIKDLMIEKKLDTAAKEIVPIVEVDNQIAAYMAGLTGPFNNRVSFLFYVNEKSEKIVAINSVDLSL